VVEAGNRQLEISSYGEVMVDYKLETQQYFITPNKIKEYELIQEDLSTVEDLLLIENPGQHHLMTEAAEQLLKAGGKRIRAAICLLTGGLFEVDREKLLSLAAGVEMLHTATLVHDDFIDGSLVRRGKPTLNAGSNAKFSVLIGDYFFARAANLVAETNNLDIMKLFSETLMTILNGELHQEFSRWHVDRGEYFDRIYAKTGAMFVLAVKSAATLGEASEEDIRAMENYGYSAGTAFQIVDDLLDFTAKQAQLGKPVGSDLREGILTLPVLLYASQHPDDPDMKLVLELQDGDHPAAGNLIASIQESGVIEAAMAEAKELVSRAQEALEGLPYTAFRGALSSIANTIVNRSF
jgi:geranylgeranyl pyrophosphate synthase